MPDSEPERSKSARVKVFLHLWGGLCAVLTAKATGMSQGMLHLLGSSSAHLVASVSGVATAAIFAFGCIASVWISYFIDKSVNTGSFRTVLYWALPVLYLAVSVAFSFLIMS